MEVTIKLDLRRSGKTEKGFPIIVYVSKNYKNRKWRTGHYAHQNQWSEKLAAPKSKHPDYYVIQENLSSLKARINELLKDHRSESMTLPEIKHLLFKKNHKQFHAAAMDSFVDGYKGTVWSAVRSFNTFMPHILFEEITPEVVQRYKAYLMAKGNRPGGIDSYLRSLRAIWNKLTNEPNPFKSIKVNIPEKLNTVATVNDIRILAKAELGPNKSIGGYANYRNYWLLMFYLGGIDPEVLAKLRYDEHVVNGRINFNRNKGGSNTACSNLIPREAMAILEQYDCHPYLVPIFRSADYAMFRRNFSRRIKVLCPKLGLSVILRPKSARYTFIDRAQQLLIDERITAQIVGHKRKTTTSIYTNDFPVSVQDNAHLRIINIEK